MALCNGVVPGHSLVCMCVLACLDENDLFTVHHYIVNVLYRVVEHMKSIVHKGLE